METLKKISKSLPLALLTVVVIAIPFLLANILFAGAAVAQAMAQGGGVVEDTVTTEKVEETQEDLNMEEVSQKITKMRPSATPLATIFSEHAKKRKVQSQITEFYAVDIKPFSDTVDGDYDQSTGDGEDYASIKVNDVTLFNVDDTVMFPDIEGEDGQPFVGAISEKDNVDNTIKIQPLNGPKGSGDMEDKEIVPKEIPSGETIVRMGPAKSELDASTSPFAMMPEKEYNYCQNFMAQVEESVFQRLTKTEVPWNFTDYEEMNIYDMKARMELSYLWGIRKNFVDKSDQERKYTCGGLTQFMDKTLDYTYDDGLTNDLWVDWTRAMFADNAGSDTRFAFFGDDLLAQISKIDGVEKQLNGQNTEVVWGITFNKVETKFGILYIKRHPLFRLVNQGKNGIALDVNNLEEHEFVPMKFTTLELKKAGMKNADATVLQKVACPILRYPATHAFIKAG